MNQATIVGNVGQDPKIVSTQGGQVIANLSIATSERWNDKQTGEKKEKTEWHRVTVYGKLAEVVQRYVKKGDKLLIQGKLETRKWTDANNIERYTTEIVLNQFGSTLEMLSSAKGNGVVNSPAQEPKGGSMQNELDDEIPF